MAALAMIFSVPACYNSTTYVPTSTVSQPAIADASSGSFRIIYWFPIGEARSHGAFPNQLVEYNGLLYGTTGFGGPFGGGTVFSLEPSGENEKVIYAFRGLDGLIPVGGLTVLNGIFYGAAAEGGLYGAGTVFAVSPSGQERTLHAFSGGRDGATPEAGLVAMNGKLYGTTAYGGGRDQYGTVFEVTTSGVERVIHTFAPRDQDFAATPLSRLTALNGALYGTTQSARHGFGALYAVTPSGDYRNIHEFSVDNEGYAAGGVTELDGVLYGATQGGWGKHRAHAGAIYEFRPPSNYTVITHVGRWPYGMPSGDLTVLNGSLYGVSSNGGAYHQGNVFEVSPPRDRHIICSFQYRPDGRLPSTLLAYGGALYGSMDWGGKIKEGPGTIFKVMP